MVHWLRQGAKLDVPEWLATNRDDMYWEGLVGKPEVKHRTSGLRFATRNLEVQGAATSFVDVRPVESRPSCWRALSATGQLISFSSTDGTILTSTPLNDLGFDITAETGFCLSPDDQFAVVSQASGPNAALAALHTSSTVRKFSRGDYHPENSHFPTAFFLHDGKMHLIAASDWNRLDLYDPATGNLLSERGPTHYISKERPPRCLDYFHGGLSVSPDHQHVVDNGWVWHPVGALRAWNLPAWLRNPWESEDGPTSWNLAWRDYFGDGPVCWINAATLAFWGWGKDDDWLVPAAVLEE